MKRFSSATQKTGEIGESIACRFLEERGFKILERNFTRKWGEIDVVASRAGKTHFVEVKSVSRENASAADDAAGVVRPEDHMHAGKQERLIRTIESYLAAKPLTDWQFDVVCVYLDADAKKARVRLLEDVILGSD